MRTLFAILICIIFIMTSVSTSEAKIIRVPGDYQEIWAAARFADGGDVIQVAPGVYEEFDIYISTRFMKNPGPITLQGTGATTTTIIGNVEITGNNKIRQAFKIDGFRIEGRILVNKASITISHNFITNSPSSQSGKVSGGIVLRYSYYCKIRIEENIIKNTRSGIRCEGNDRIDEQRKADVLIMNNIIEDNEAGISLYMTSPVIRGNRIVDNRWGIDIHESTKPDLGTYGSPGGNTIYENTEYDIRNDTD